MAGDPDEAAGAALVASMAGGKGGAADRPIDPDEAAGMALVKTLGAVKSEPKAAPPEPSIDPITGFPIDADGRPIDGGKTTLAGDGQGTLTPPAPFNLPRNPADLRAMLAETPGWTSGGILPIRVKQDAAGNADPSLGVRPDLGPLRGIGTGILDLLEGPSTGTVTPEARNLLALAAMGGKLTPSVARGTGASIIDTAQRGADAVAAPLSPEFRANPGATVPTLPPGEMEPNRLRLSGPASVNQLAMPPPEPAPMAGAPQPQSVGAAASRDMSPPGVIDMTPAQVQAYRSTAEGQKLLEPQPHGVPDDGLYVPGVRPNSAEIEQTVNTARELKALNVTAPDVSQAAKDMAAANNEARQRFVESTIKSPVDVMNAKAARAAQAETDLATTWRNKTEADAQPVIDAANAIKTSPDGRRPVVRSALDAVTKELYDADGELITDPEQLYGVRKHLDDLLSKEAGASDPKSVRAAANLQELKTSLDGVIEQAAPGFKEYLKNYSDASRPIDEMEVLQGHQSRLYDTQGRIQLSRVQGMMKNIVDSRAAPGLNPYKSISDETIQRLFALRDDLRRSASAQELARTPGSDTTQTMWDTTKGLAKMGASGAAQAAAHVVAPIAGPIIFNSVRAIRTNQLAGKAAQAQTARGMNLLNPTTPLRNRLLD